MAGTNKNNDVAIGTPLRYNVVVRSSGGITVEIKTPWLAKYFGFEVDVFYKDANRDKGKLTDAGDGWIELTRTNHDTLLIPIGAIRLLKPVEPPDDESRRLLRPATPDQ